MIGAGIYVLVSSDLKFLSDFASKDSVIKTAGFILIGTGCFIFIVGFCGCCGAIRESECLLGFVSLENVSLLVSKFSKSSFKK